jgi:hypothetical protein
MMTLLYTNVRASSRKRKRNSEKNYKMLKKQGFMPTISNSLVRKQKVRMNGRNTPYIEIVGT